MAVQLKIEDAFWNDQDWALQHYPEMVEKYRNQWVAVYNRQVIAAGDDLRQVEAQAAKKTGQPEEKIAVVFVESGNQVF